mgnify:CR=1 FL=1
MEEAILQLVKALTEQKKKENGLPAYGGNMLEVQIPPKARKRQYIVSATGNFDERIKKAARATQLRHLLARVKSMESTLSGMDKFLKDCQEDDFSFGGRFDPMIQQIKDEIAKAKNVLNGYASTVSLPAIPEEPEEKAPTISENVQEIKKEAEAELKKVEEEIKVLEKETEEPSKPDILPPVTPSAPVETPAVEMQVDNTVKPEKRKREEEVIPAPEVLHSKETGVIHQNTRVAPTPQVTSTPLATEEPVAPPEPIKFRVIEPNLPKPNSKLADFYRQHLSRN